MEVIHNVLIFREMKHVTSIPDNRATQVDYYRHHQSDKHIPPFTKLINDLE